MTPSFISLQIGRGHLTFKIAETDDDWELFDPMEVAAAAT